MTRNNILCLAVCIILSVQLPVHANSKAYDSRYHISFQVETTSDWTDFNFTNSDFHYLGETILTSNLFSLGIFSISKKPFDSTLTKVEYQIFFPLDLPGQIKFSVRKGRIGYTKITFLTLKRETLAYFINKKQIPNDSFNQEDFFLNSKILKDTKGMNETTYTKSHYDLLPATVPLILAFYFPWYYEENWHWTGKLSIAHRPRLGLYSSSDERILKTHIDLAKEAGIDGFICSWWGINSVTDQNLKKLAQLCDKNNFKFSIYLEDTKNPFDLREQIQYLESTFAQYKSFLYYKNKPVLFIFNRILEKISLDSLRSIKSGFSIINYGYGVSNLQGFEGYHEFVPPVEGFRSVKQTYRLAKEVAYSKGKLFAAPVMPGFDDRFVNTKSTYINRNKGKYYKNLWEAVLAIKPDWILINTFNEWFEGTEIEPSKEFGDFYLKLTKTYSQKFKSSKI